MPFHCTNPDCPHPEAFLPSERWAAKTALCDDCLRRDDVDFTPGHEPMTADVLEEMRRDHGISQDTAIARARGRAHRLA